MRVHRKVYEDIDARQLYSLLQDTPHFFGLVTWLLGPGDRAHGFVHTLVSAARVDDAAAVVGAYHAANPEADSAVRVASLGIAEPIEGLKAFIHTGPDARARADLLDLKSEEQRKRKRKAGARNSGGRNKGVQ